MNKQLLSFCPKLGIISDIIKTSLPLPSIISYEAEFYVLQLKQHLITDRMQMNIFSEYSCPPKIQICKRFSKIWKNTTLLMNLFRFDT